MANRFAACVALAACCACGGDDGPPATPSTPPPDFSVSCQPAGLAARAGCASSGCTVTSANAFAGAVTLSCSGQPAGIACGFGPNPLAVTAGGSARSGFTIASDPTVPDGVHTFEVAAAGGGLRRTTRVAVQTAFVAPPPPVSSRSFVVSGCTGYVDGVLGGGTLQTFVGNFVAARNDAFDGPQCVQSLAASDGRFDLEIPRGCFGDGEAVYLTAGGLAGCATRPFAGGSTAWAVLLGRRSACP